MSASGVAKRPAPSKPSGAPPAVKARIAKSGGDAPAAAKGAPAKAPAAPAAPAAAPAAAAAPKADGPPAQPESWHDIDPFYALLGDVSTDKVTDADGNLRPEPLAKYLDRIFIQKAAKKPKDWVEIWAAMDIPVANQSVVLTPILAYALEHAPEGFGRILAELLKGHRVKTKALDEAAQGAYKGSRDKTGILKDMLFIIFPKGPQSEWGWSRVGWSWQEWWKLLENVYNAVDKASAFDELAALLERIEAEGGMPLSKQNMVWNETRLNKVRSLLCKYGGLEDEKDLVACMDATVA